MVINCPACSTGFNLPEKHITAKGTKLRCSKCGHVFRVRRNSPDEEVSFFYKPEDEANNEENGTAISAEGGGGDTNEKTQFGVGASAEGSASVEDADEGPSDNPSTVELEPMSMLGGDLSEGTGNKTNFGMPATSDESKGGLFGSSNDDDPFPHAGGNLKDLFGGGKKESAKPKDKPESAAAAPAPEIDTSTKLGVANVDAPTPAEEAIKGQTQLGTGISGSTETAAPAEDPAPAEPAPTQEQAPEPAPTQDPEPAPAKPSIDLFEGEQSPAATGEDPFGDAFGEDALDIDPLSGSPAAEEEEEPILRPGQPGMAIMGNSVSSAHDHGAHAPQQPVMESHGLQQNSSMTADFWNEQGGDMAEGGLAEPSFADGPSFDPERGIVEDEAPQPQQQAAPRPAAQPRRAAPQPASTGLKQARPVAQEDDWPSDIETIAPHKIGGSGLQKVANLLLIVLIVMVGFFGLVAALNDGFIDFKNFGSMIGVAFGGEEYKPREEWLPKEKPKPVPPKKDILRTQSVYAEVIPITKKSSVLVLRGRVKNLDQQEYIDIKLRGILLNSKDKIIAEKEAPLGELIPNAKFTELSSLTELPDILPKHPKPLKVGETEPFTIVFDEIPQQIKDGEPILFRVEFAERVGAQDLK